MSDQINLLKIRILGDVVDIKSLNCYLCLYGISKKRRKAKGKRQKAKGERQKVKGERQKAKGERENDGRWTRDERRRKAEVGDQRSGSKDKGERENDGRWTRDEGRKEVEQSRS